MTDKKYEVIPTKKFEDDVDYYIKKKKFKHIVDDLDMVVSELEKGNFEGQQSSNIGLGDTGYTIKVHIANSDTKDGKSNGYRMIYYVVLNDKEVYLISIYYKKDDRMVLSNHEIKTLVEKYCL